MTLEAREGEVLFLLGPSGSGKSTALRLIGGYERPDAGEVVLGGAVANGVPAHRRNVGMVFQSYALFPHMTVAQNVAFGLRMRGASRAEQHAAVAWSLDLVRLGGLEGRYPGELSGGQQQRVALARAIAFRPGLLLLDEPLANLDRHLRDEMRLELKALQRRLGLTTVFVTHDQEEALALADRIAVLDSGRLQALDTPAALYHRPPSAFVARFMGEMNLLPGRLGDPAGTGERTAHVAGARLVVHAPAGACAGDEVSVCLRAEGLRLEAGRPTLRQAQGRLDDRRPRGGRDVRAPGPTTRDQATVDPSMEAPGAAWHGTVRLVTFLGAESLYVVQLDDGPLVRVMEPKVGGAPVWRQDDAVTVRWTGGAAHCLAGAPA